MKKALVVGINYYNHIASLNGCVRDANNVNEMLARHEDGSVNFHTRCMTASGSTDAISRKQLKEAIQQLFDGDSEVALLYFAGHGYVEATGGYICSSEVMAGDEGIPLNDVMTWANRSAARNKVIVLDSCHGGAVGANPVVPDVSELSEGMTILTASTADQYADEVNGSGVFTSLFVDALNGAAANLVGAVTPGSVYAHIDQSLGPWTQRPVFKTNIRTFVSLRKVRPPLALSELRRISEFFPRAGYEFPLDPTFEPERPCTSLPGVPEPEPKNTATFEILQQFNRVNLVVPSGAPHMWHAAMQSKACRLTALGEHYRRLVQEGMI